MVGEVEAAIYPNAVIAGFLVVLWIDWPLASLRNRFLCEGVSVISYRHSLLGRSTLEWGMMQLSGWTMMFTDLVEVNIYCFQI
jgi:hypothetical protein